MEDAYKNFNTEELRELLIFRTAQLSFFEKKIEEAEKEKEVLIKEYTALKKKNTQLLEELEAVCKENQKEIEEGVDGDEVEGLDENAEDDSGELGRKLSNYKATLLKQIRSFLERKTYLEFEADMRKLVIGQDISLILVSVYKFLQNIEKGKCTLNFTPARILVTGPSGCGKTHIYRSLAKYFHGFGTQKGEIPMLQIVHIDMAGMTSAGFRGRNIDSILAALAASEGLAICFLSEIDKFTSPKFDGKNNNISANVQSEFLSILEGITLDYSSKVSVRTSDTLFILDGSFSFVREKRKQINEEEKRTVGFIRQQDKSVNIFDKISRQDILEAGCITELLGRVNLILELDVLSEAAIFMILEGYRNEIAKTLNTNLYLSDAYLAELIEIANGEFGCRLLYSKMYEAVMSAVAVAMQRGMKDGFSVTIHAGGNFELHAIDDSELDFASDFSTSTTAEEIVTGEGDLLAFEMRKSSKEQ